MTPHPFGLPTSRTFPMDGHTFCGYRRQSPSPVRYHTVSHRSSWLSEGAPRMHAWNLVRSLTPAQRNTFIASFLGWALDAFDFFLVVLVVPEIAGDFGFGRGPA